MTILPVSLLKEGLFGCREPLIFPFTHYRSIYMILSDKLFRPRIFSLLFACTLSVSAQPTATMDGQMPEDTLPDLKAILISALKQSPQMVQNEISIAQAEASRYASSSQRLPQVSANASYAWNRISADKAEPPGGFKPGEATKSEDKSSGPYYGVSLSQPLFTWYALTNQVKIADISIKISEKNYAEAYRGLANTIRSQYLGLIFQKVSLRNQRFNLNQTARLLALDEDRLKSGAMAPAELMQPRAAYAAARLAMARSDELYAVSKRQLARMAGLSAVNEEAIPLEAPVWGGTTEAPASLMARWQRDGVEGTYQGQINALRIKDAELNYKVAKTRLYPKFSLTASASQYNSQNVTAVSVTQQAAFSTTYGVSGSWTLFDGFAAKGAKRYALENKRLYEYQQKNLAVQLADQVESSVKLIGFSAQTLEMTETTRAGAAYSVQLASDEFKRGSVTEDAVTTATSQLYSQEAAVVAARIDLLARWCELVSLVGADPILNQLPARYVR